MTLTSKINWAGREVGGAVLGEPAREFPGDETTPPSGMFIWDGAGVPTGEVLADGTIVTAAVGDVVAPDLTPDDIPITKREKDAGVKKLRKRVDSDDPDEDAVLVAVDGKGKKVPLDEVYPERAERKRAREEERIAAAESKRVREEARLGF